MQQSNIPAKFPITFGSGAGSSYIRTIPQASQIGVTPGAASLTDGFPPVCFLPLAAGGIPPFGQDMNGILNEITQWNQWQQAAGPITYDATFAVSIGGYPKNSILTSTTAGKWWWNTVDNNATNPDSGGTNWTALTFGLGLTPSASTGIVAAVYGSGSIVPGHLAVFADAAGSIQDGGAIGVANPATYQITSTTIGPGTYNVDTTSGVITLTMMAVPATGNIVTIIDAFGTFGLNNCVINGNGNTIAGQGTSLNLDIPGITLSFEYKAGNWSLN